MTYLDHRSEVVGTNTVITSLTVSTPTAACIQARRGGATSHEQVTVSKIREVVGNILLGSTPIDQNLSFLVLLYMGPRDDQAEARSRFFSARNSSSVSTR